MSYDPRDYDAEPPFEYEPAAPLEDPSDARQRVQAPAIALIVVGVLNLLLTLLLVGRTIYLAMQSPQDLAKTQEESIELMGNFLPKESLDDYKKQAKSQPPESFKTQTVLITTIASAIGLLITLLTLLGEIRMVSLRSYPLCIAGAISAAIPCLSCGGTCCFGEIIGIWALIVLLSADVRAAFQ